MRLADEPFEKIKSGEKTVEIRLIRLKVENKTLFDENIFKVPV